MERDIRTQLLSLAEPEYQKFAASLIPNISNVMGVRLPAVRKIAKQIAAGDWRTYLDTAKDEYFEEVMLQGMVIGHVQAELDELLTRIAAFVPKIDNWSVCDSFCAGLKYTKVHTEAMWNFIQPYLKSEKEYDIRFGVVMLLNFYLEQPYIHQVLPLLDQIKHEAYYVKMAVAWAISIAYVKQPEATMPYLRHNTLDDFTYNKALQKITESYRVTPEDKQVIRSMKRKVKVNKQTIAPKETSS
ncbi:DNA alkylation repair protein [Paenibacillus silvae]|uniref:DNA alkylation repair protein n=1 Tax=Paenibacillus silvae TaxID=1325358 RepID=UPI002006B2E0|nr:DNA alkylation repair protein [Paenibacillus silvae]MCK6075056.1 DNA alkylation repair protein [Paenibacillus silvae]MCK6149443.1 DNA alkylation repair protein [Paenibacillus silvae]MCK6267742.1 DNA alkylation repair protein [Paenibacillus silvae]